jgi:hypothetical protein
MGLEDELKAKTLALISQQMANWVVEIQRSIADHQANLVRSLDELQENVARYDERINEDDIGNSMAEVVAANPPPAPPPAGPGYEALKGSIAAIEKGASLSEVLTYLVNEVAQYVDRAAMFIVKGPSAIGWYARGFSAPEAVKTVSVPLNGDTVFRNVHSSRRSTRGHISHSPGTAQALARLGGDSQGIVAVPLILRDKLAAILYADSYQEEIPADTADLVEILVLFAGKTIDLLSAPRPAAAAAAAATTGGTTTDRAAAIRASGEDVRERAGVPRASAPPPQPAAASDGEGSSTVMFNASSFGTMKPQAAPRPSAPPPPRPGPPPAPAARALSPEDQKAHEEAKRFARLVVSEIKLYNETKVNEGRRNKDIYERLKEDIERGRQMYSDRVAGHVRDSTNYFYDELVRILAGGDAGALGPM